MKRNIGIYGGSFDPVHLGHMLVAQASMEEAGLERLYFVPAAQSPFKQGTNPTLPKERLRLLRLALAGKSNYEIDLQEISRGGVSFTIDTVRDYVARFPDANLFYLIGADNVADLTQWKAAGELARLASFLVIPRPGQPSVCPPEPFKSILLKGFPLGVSSSEIRARVKAGLPIDHLVSQPVAEAIRNYHLYF
jgi:nicotinate-nucleotide adenylyltransferase